MILLFILTPLIFAENWRFYTETKIQASPTFFKGCTLPYGWKEEKANSFQKKKFIYQSTNKNITLTWSHFKGKTGTLKQNVKRWIRQIDSQFNQQISETDIQKGSSAINPDGLFINIGQIIQHCTPSTQPQKLNQNILVAYFFYDGLSHFLKMQGSNEDLKQQASLFETIYLKFQTYLLEEKS